tara:strand:- start:316 stop:465 length:150 start_codon:yes stop_codon:yes gene_type:complete
MATVEVNDEAKKRLKYFKKMYEKKRGKTTWKEFMDLIVDEIACIDIEAE